MGSRTYVPTPYEPMLKASRTYVPWKHCSATWLFSWNFVRNLDNMTKYISSSEFVRRVESTQIIERVNSCDWMSWLSNLRVSTDENKNFIRIIHKYSTKLQKNQQNQYTTFALCLPMDFSWTSHRPLMDLSMWTLSPRPWVRQERGMSWLWERRD